MSELPNKPQDSESPDPTPPRKKRRRWPKILLGLAVLLILLVLLLPTIASTGPARSYVVGKINEQVSGQVQIDGWSLGWFSPISVSGIKVYDDEKRLVLDVPRVKLGISLLGAIRQNFALGDDNVIDVASFLVTVDQHKNTSIERLARGSAAQPKPPGGGSTPSRTSGGGSAPLPEVSGKFTVNILQGTIESEEKAWPAVHVRPSEATATISSINQPIQSTLKLVYQVGEAQESTIQTSGSIAAIKNNVLDLTGLAAGQKVNLTNVNLAAAAPFLSFLPRVAGLINGGIDIKTEGLAGLSASGQFKVTGLELGDYKTAEMTIPVTVTRSALAGGDSLIKFENVGLQTSQGTIALTGQVTEKSLVNLVDHKAPGADGSIALVASVTDLKDLANQFKETLKLQQGVAVTGGSGREELTVTLTKDEVKIAQNLKVQATGTRDGRAIEIKPITVAANATARPNGTAVPDVRDIKLAVESSFATVTGGGDSLAKLAITGKVALNTLSSELSQFVDMQKVQLQGGGEFAINTDGDLTSDSTPVKLMSRGTFQNVKVVGLLDQPIDQDRLAFEASGIVAREKNIPTTVDKGYLAIVGGDPAAPLLDVEANGVVDLKTSTVPWFELKKCTITSLPKLQEQYGGLVPVLAKNHLKIDSGALYATAGGSFDGTTLAFSKPAGVSIPTLSISQDGRTILNREVVRASVNGKISLKDGVAGEFTELSVTTESKLVTLAKGGQGPLTFTMIRHEKDSVLKGSGVMTLAADLKRLADLAQAFGGTVTVSPDQPQIRGGTLNGTITLAKATAPQTDLKFDGQITGLTIANAAGPIAQNEQLAINLTAAAPDDLNANPISANAKVTGSFINASVSDAKVGLNGSALDTVRSAVVDAQITDLAKAYSLVSAATGTRAPTTGPALPPLQITGGSASLKMNVTRDVAGKSTNLTITDAQVSRLALKRGAKSFAFDPNTPITVKLNASVKGTDQLDSLEVRELAADARIATLSMPEKITITGLTTARPVYQGSIAAKGTLKEATPLLAVLQGAEPMPYEGSYDINQKFATRAADGVVTLAGAVDVRDFRVISAGRPAFSEPQVAIRNDLDLDPNGKKLAVKTLTLSMPQSQALGLSFTGGVNDWEKARNIRPNTKLDVTYDLEKVWTIVRPMLTAEQQATYKDLKVAGKYQKSFTLTGAFPEGPIDKSFASLNADGSLAIDLLDTMGLNIQKLQPTVKMTRGKVVITGTPAVLNEGSLDVSEIVIDMSRPSPELTVARNKRMIRNAKLNPVLANSIGKYVSPIFVDSKKASGLLDLTVIECQQVPIGALMTQGDAARAKIVYSVRDIQVDGIVPNIMSEFLALGTPGLVGEIPESTVTLADGSVASDLTFAIRRTGTDRRGQEVVSQLPLKFNGSVGMKNLELKNFQALIPKDLLPDEILGLNLRQVRSVLPPQIKVPITGTLTKLHFDPAKAVAANLNPLQGGENGQDPLKNLGNILEQQLGGQRNQNPPPRGRGQ